MGGGMGGGGGWSGGGGGWHGGGGWNGGGGWHGGSGWNGSGGWHGGSGWNGGSGWHGGCWNCGWHGGWGWNGSRWVWWPSVNVWWGVPGAWWWPTAGWWGPWGGWWGPSPGWSSASWADPGPVTYIQRDSTQSFDSAPPATGSQGQYDQNQYGGQGQYTYYYCSDPAGYYPQVANCNRPWTRVIPNSPPPTSAPTIQ